MEGWFSHCVFCTEELPPLGQRGKGEHIIPEFLMGSWCTKDVCVACNNHFGAHVDHVALEDPRIIDAIHQLDLPDLKARLLDKATATTTDLDTGRRLRTKTKAGKAKIVRQDLDGIVDHDETDGFDTFLRTVLRRPPAGLTGPDIEAEVARLQALYEGIQPGQMVTSDKLGRAFRKGRARTTYEFKVTPGAASRLIAKIAYEAAFLFLSINRLQAYLPSLRALSAHARNGEPIDDFILFRQPTPRGHTYDPAQARHGHTITCSYGHGFAGIDVSLFALANYRVHLLPRPDAPPVSHEAPAHNGQRVTDARMVITFEPGRPREKLCLLFVDEEDTPLRFDLTGRA